MSFYFRKPLIAPYCLQNKLLFLGMALKALQNLPTFLFNSSQCPSLQLYQVAPKWAMCCQASWLLLKLLHGITSLSFMLHSPAHPSGSKPNVTNFLKASLTSRCCYTAGMTHHLIDTRISLVHYQVFVFYVFLSSQY